MRGILFIIISILFIASCSERVEGYDKPKDLIVKDKMIRLISEMVKLETHIKETYVRVDRFHLVMTASGDSLIKSKGFTPDQYESSLKYYASHQDQMQEIYSEVLEDLNKELGELEDQRK